SSSANRAEDRLSFATISSSSRAETTAATAGSSKGDGTPKTARNPSPRNLLMIPPFASTQRTISAKRVQGPNAFARVMRFSISRESAQVRDQNGRWPHFRPVAAWSREEFGHPTGRDVLAEEAHNLSVGGGGRNG